VYGNDSWPHPRYLDREHLTPGDDTRYAACASVINQMKGSMGEAEFREAVLRVAAAYDTPAESSQEVTLLRGRLKTNLEPQALRAVVMALAARFAGGEFDESVFALIESQGGADLKAPDSRC
jgi:hypothetical protein